MRVSRSGSTAWRTRRSVSSRVGTPTCNRRVPRHTSPRWGDDARQRVPRPRDEAELPASGPQRAGLAGPRRRRPDPGPDGRLPDGRRLARCRPDRRPGARRAAWAVRRGRRELLGADAGQRVDGDRDRQDERRVLARRDVDAVGLAHAEPLLGDLRDGVAVALDLVLVVDDVALRFHVVAVLDVDRKAVADPY